MRWEHFTDRCPELATLVQERFRRDQLVLLGTLRRDGWPRISPCEVDFAAGHLFLGMMWRSRKALDLLRDPRVVVHSVTTNKDGTDGDVKLYGRALEITDPALRDAFRAAIQARINWAPDEPEYHLFALDVERAAYVVFEDGELRILTWDPAHGGAAAGTEAVRGRHTTPSLHARSALGGDGPSRHEAPSKTRKP